MHTPEHAPAHDRLLEHQTFLRQLARSLVADPHRAEDLAQEATLIALQRPPRPGPMGAWLARVVRNLSISGSRSEGRRVAREQTAHRPEPPRTPEELEAHFEVQRRVVDAVGRLEEPYKSTILLRYYHDLGPAAIAEQQGVSAATVKTRLARGLAKLRTDLDEHDVDGTQAWAVVLLSGLDESQATVIGSALAAGGASMVVKLTLAGAVAAVGAIAGTWWMLQPAVDPSARFDLRGGSAGTPSAVAEASRLHTPPAEQSRAALDALQLRAPPAEESRTALESTSAETLTSEPEPSRIAWGLALELRGWKADDKEPIEVQVGRSPKDEPAIASRRQLAEQINVNVGELFANPHMRPSQITLKLDHPAYLPAEIGVLVPEEMLGSDVATGRLQVAVDLVRAKAIVVGTVEVPGGLPVHTAPDSVPAEATLSGAEEARLELPSAPIRASIFAMKGDMPESLPIDSVEVDDKGRFRLRADAAERHAVVAYVDRGSAWSSLPPREGPALRPETRLLPLQWDQVLELDPLVLGEGEVLEGRVMSLGGGPPPAGRAKAELMDAHVFHDLGLAWKTPCFELAANERTWEDDGHLRISGLAPARYRLRTQPVWSRSPIPLIRVQDSGAAIELTAPDRAVQITLDLVRLTFVVLGEGLPLAKANVNAIQRTEDGFQTTGTYTDAVGQVSVELDPREGLTLTVADARFPKLEVSYSSEELTPNARIEIPLQGAPIDPATLVVHLDGNRSAPPPDMLVTFHLYDKVKLTEKELDQVRQNSIEGGSGGSRSFVWLRPSGALPNLTEAEGQWAISALPPSKYLVRIAPRSSDSGPPCMLLGEVFEVDLQAGASVEHTWQAKEGGVLRLNLSAITDLQRARIVDSTGNPVAAQFSRERSTPGSHSSSSMVQEPCTYDVQSALAAGDYGLSIVSRDGSKRIVAFHIEAGKVNDVVVTPGDL